MPKAVGFSGIFDYIIDSKSSLIVGLIYIFSRSCFKDNFLFLSVSLSRFFSTWGIW